MLKKRIVLLAVVALAAYLKYSYADNAKKGNNDSEENTISLSDEKKKRLDS